MHVHTHVGILTHVHASVVLGLAGLAVAYAAVARRTRAPVEATDWLAFGGALATLYVALGPVDAVADARCFTAHMLQHLLLALVVPPLLLLGVPPEALRPALRVRGVRALARRLTNPLVAFGLYNALLIAVHVPVVFDRMVRDQPVHVALHLALLATGTIAWWPMTSRLPELPRLSYPGQLLYLFALMIPMAAVSAPITYAPAVLYPWYLEGPHPLGLAPRADQVLGGLLMWIGAGFYVLCIMSAIFFRWARFEDRDAPAVGRPLTLLKRDAR
jgi:putative membrane protein